MDGQQGHGRPPVSFRNPMKAYIFVETGEYRVPQPGEWVNDGGCQR